MASPGAVVAPLARNNNLRYAAMLGEENRFTALHRLRDLWEDLSRWAAQAFWIAVLVLCPINYFTEAFQLRENRISGGRPHKGTPVEIVIDDIGVDLLHQLFDTAEGAAPNGLLSDEPEPALDLIEPTRIGRGVVQMIARMSGEPGLDLGMLMGAVVVRDQMNLQPRRNAGVEMFEKAQKLLVAVARLALGDNRTMQHVERREQSGGAVAVIIVGYAFDVAQAHRQHRLGTFQRLDLALLVDAQHQRLVRRIEIQTHDVAHLLYEERVGRELEALSAMRLQTEQREIATHRALGDAAGFGRQAHAPVAGGFGFALRH